MRSPISSTASAMPGYRGVRHARLTRSMTRLAPALQVVLAELRYRIADGDSAHVSNRVLAQATGYSEGYISVLVRQLAGETVTMRVRGQPLIYPAVPDAFIRRVWDEERGGFLITMLAPPELRPAPVPPGAAPPVPEPSPFVQLPLFPDLPGSLRDHSHDPSPEPPPAAPECQKPGQDGDHPADPISNRSETMQQQLACSLTLEDEPPAELRFPEAWPRMRQGTPGYSHADYRRDRARAETRALRSDPDCLVVWSVSRGLPVYGADDLAVKCEGGKNNGRYAATNSERRESRRRRERAGYMAASHSRAPVAEWPDFLRRTAPGAQPRARGSIDPRELPDFLRRV